MTAIPHPNAMTIQPEFWALDLLSRTAATTPSPKRISSPVPMISQPMMCCKASPSLTTGDRRDTNQARSALSNAVRLPRSGSSDNQPCRSRLPRNIQSIERAAAILRLLSGRTHRMGVVDLAGELGLPKGTVHGLLRTLQHVGFVEQDEETGKYQLGAALLHMGS